ncbi:MAG: hypothetical protein GF311_23095, partial [Candidatus Lokiarchaeota archaeon]|nr:hypothetical protein [Candidatus Lokiarchaeota archaeon]
MVETEKPFPSSHPDTKSGATIPENPAKYFEDFIRANQKYSDELIKQVLNGSKSPLIELDLDDLEEEYLINKFRKKPEVFFEILSEILIKVARFNNDFKDIYEELENLDEFQGVHIIPKISKNSDWMIPVQKNLSSYLVKYLDKIYRFKGRFMSLGLQRKIEFRKIKWMCVVCGKEFETAVLRRTREKYRHPSFCINKRCKASSKRDFLILPEKSTAYEKRLFAIIDVENKDMINEIPCYINNNIKYFQKKARNLHMNDEIEVMGILKLDTADVGSMKEDQAPDYYINVIDINLEHINNIDPEVIKQIKKKLKKDPLFCNRIIDSIHPFSQRIFNYFPIKLMYALQHISSDSWDEANNKRNGINIIVGGHAGTLKSGIARHFKRILGPTNFGIIGGKNTTSKGLVPVAQRNNNEKDLVKRYGAIPYYNRKTFLIDEAQYLYRNDPDALETTKCFEEGVISRALDGTTINAEAKGTIGLSVNYKTPDEAYDYTKSLVENLGFPEDQKSVLDRFDVHYAAPRNTDRIVKLLEKRDRDNYMPGFQESDTIIYNYLMEAKRIYSEGISMPKDAENAIMKIYHQLIIEKKKSKPNAILNPRESNIIKKVIKAIAALRLRKKVNDDDFEYFKKYLIDTMIPFMGNEFIENEKTIDMNHIFRNAFELLRELYDNHFDIKEYIEFLIEYMNSNYFHRVTGNEGPNLEAFIDRRTNLSNNKFRKLLDENEDFIEENGYVVDKMKNTTSIIKKEWALQ